MNSKWNLFASIFQLVIGLLAVAAFIILVIGGEDIRRWIITLILSIFFVAQGIIGIINFSSKK